MSYSEISVTTAESRIPSPAAAKEYVILQVAAAHTMGLAQ